MKILTLILLTLLVCTSCLKKEQTPNEESKIVDLLNKNESSNALEKINNELNNHKTDELLYLKASALSMNAGIDVYALFPLLKVKIFDVAISEWSQNREFQKRNDAQRSTIGINNQDVENQGKISKDEIKQPPKLTPEQLEYNQMELNYISPYTQAAQFCSLEIIVFLLTPPPTMNNYGTYGNIQIKNEDTCKKVESNHSISKEDIDRANDQIIKNTIQSSYQSSWNYHQRDINKKNTYVKILGSFWTVIDLLPMITKIPKVSADGFNKLSEAQELLLQIKIDHNKDEIGEKARKQLLMLSALKIVAHVQNAFDLSMIKNPMDFVCATNDQSANELVDSEKDALYIVNSIEDPEILNKNKDLFDEIKAKYSLIVQEDEDHPEKKDLRIQKLKHDLDMSKLTDCSQPN